MRRRVVKKVRFDDRLTFSNKNGLKVQIAPGVYSLEMETVISTGKTKSLIRWVLLDTDIGLFRSVFLKKIKEEPEHLVVLKLSVWDHLRNFWWMLRNTPPPESAAKV